MVKQSDVCMPLSILTNASEGKPWRHLNMLPTHMHLGNAAENTLIKAISMTEINIVNPTASLPTQDKYSVILSAACWLFQPSWHRISILLKFFIVTPPFHPYMLNWLHSQLAGMDHQASRDAPTKNAPLPVLLGCWKYLHSQSYHQLNAWSSVVL